MPTIVKIHPSAALPGGDIEVYGSALDPTLFAAIAGVPAQVLLARPQRAIVRVPEGALPGELVVSHRGAMSNAIPVHVGVIMAENLHPVASPAVDAEGNLYTTLSGSRGQAMPVSVFKIVPAPEGIVPELRPFVRGILNPTGLAFGPDGFLYVSSRAEGAIYRVDASGHATLFAEGLGIATGLAFDQAGDLYVGDRSGTIFKVSASAATSSTNTFVFATLEPSIAAYHLAFDSHGTLYVTGPTTASNQTVQAIDRNGNATVFFRGLGRAQGLTFDRHDNLLIAASLSGDRGIIRITPAGEASLVVAGSNIVGICLLDDSHAALTTRDAVFLVEI